MAFGLMAPMTSAFIVFQTRADIWITPVLLALYHCAGLTGRQVSGIKRDDKIVVEEV
jgi:hypothetical protein